jgi:hypothetical protein
MNDLGRVSFLVFKLQIIFNVNNLIMIVVDNLRYDCLSCAPEKPIAEKYYLDLKINTPTLDRLAEEGVFFTSVISTGTDTPTSHASILTGFYPPKTGIREMYSPYLSNEVMTLFEILSGHGFLNISFNGHVLFHIDGIYRGVDVKVNGNVGKLLSVIENNRERRLFVFAHFFEVHQPYLHSYYPPDDSYLKEFLQLLMELKTRFMLDFDIPDWSQFSIDREQYMRKLDGLWRHVADTIFERGIGNPVEVLFPIYIRGVNKFDSMVLRDFMQGLKNAGILDDSVLVVVSDHGESALFSSDMNGSPTEQRLFIHRAVPIYDLIRVPMIIKAKGIERGRMISTQVSTVDVVPTVLDLLDISNRSSCPMVHGKSLLPLIEGRDGSGSAGYAERGIWKGFKPDDMVENFYRSGKIPKHRSIICFRSIVKDGYQYIERGSDITDEDRKIEDDREYIERLFERSFGTYESSISKNIASLVDGLKNGSFSRNAVELFVQNQAKLRNKYMLFNTRKDPMCEVNLLALDPERYAKVSKVLREKMTSICSDQCTPTSHTPDTVDSDSKQHVIDRLKGLGYL